jgi:uncharacterized protein (DUF305 family)
MKRLLSSVTITVVAALTLAACGSNDTSSKTDSASNSASSSSSATSSDFNKADVTFAQSMIPHHQQAVQMSKMARAHASTTQLKVLAAKIEVAQGPEIDTMSGWLKGWGKKVPSGSMGGMGHGMGSMDAGDMPGMMSDADMNSLDSAHGSGFDRMWVTMMIKHHTGAIAMAKTEQSKGQNGDAVALAKKIAADQTAEIAVMRTMLKS